jgi:hypothetical protein
MAGALLMQKGIDLTRIAQHNEFLHNAISASSPQSLVPNKIQSLKREFHQDSLSLNINKPYVVSTSVVVQ